MVKKRTTVYLDDKLVKLLKIRAIQNDQSVSDHINQVLYEDLADDLDDLNCFEKRANEPTVSFESVSKELKTDENR